MENGLSLDGSCADPLSTKIVGRSFSDSASLLYSNVIHVELVILVG